MMSEKQPMEYNPDWLCDYCGRTGKIHRIEYPSGDVHWHCSECFNNRKTEPRLHGPFQRYRTDNLNVMISVRKYNNAVDKIEQLTKENTAAVDEIKRLVNENNGLKVALALADPATFDKNVTLGKPAPRLEPQFSREQSTCSNCGRVFETETRIMKNTFNEHVKTCSIPKKSEKPAPMPLIGDNATKSREWLFVNCRNANECDYNHDCSVACFDEKEKNPTPCLSESYPPLVEVSTTQLKRRATMAKKLPAHRHEADDESKKDKVQP